MANGRIFEVRFHSMFIVFHVPMYSHQPTNKEKLSSIVKLSSLLLDLVSDLAYKLQFDFFFKL